MANLSIDGETFKVVIEGEADRPALMLSHSLGVDLSMWEGQAALLARHFRVIRYDTRGHGGSSGEGPVSIARLGRDALAILDALNIEKTHWLGLSMGGAVGLWLLAHAPERIERAVLCNTAPRLGTPESWNTRIASVLGDGMRETAHATIERWFSAGFIAREPGRVDAIRDLLLRTAPAGYAGCGAALRDMDLRERVRQVPHEVGPHEVLVVSGRDDPVVPQDDIERLVASMPGARHVVLDARHMSNIEAEAAFNAAVAGFLTAKSKAQVSKARVSKAQVSKAHAPTRRRRTETPAAGKRVKASGHSNPARSPLKPTAKRDADAAAEPKAASAPIKRKTPAPRRRPAAKTTLARTARKAAAKKPRKVARKGVAARRPTPRSAARGAVRSAVKKAKPSKAAAKAPRKAVAKASLSKAGLSKAGLKKPPLPRRKPTKPRRPTGRRKT